MLRSGAAKTDADAGLLRCGEWAVDGVKVRVALEDSAVELASQPGEELGGRAVPHTPNPEAH
jgi:hypothetical protein